MDANLKRAAISQIRPPRFNSLSSRMSLSQTRRTVLRDMLQTGIYRAGAKASMPVSSADSAHRRSASRGSTA